jgi:hypothetical protein
MALCVTDQRAVADARLERHHWIGSVVAKGKSNPKFGA